MLTNAKLVFNKNINEKHTEAAIKHAEYLCLQKQQKFTSLRRTVFEILWEDYQPLGAYEIKERLSMRLGKKIDPPTVYRAIEFFVDLGLANKIESLNAYIGCP
ncbi:MAG: transcriptional repressor, partial [Pseudomonadota bacterium]|nr:transcriptional repressor [Pseudomonadota bacterium]